MPGLMQQWFTTKSPPHVPAQFPPAQPARSTITGSAVAPGTDKNQFTNNELAYYQQLLQGTGQGDTVPQSIQDNIAAQAALI